MTKVVEKFLRYVKIDTKSSEGSETCPTTESQYKFGELLVEELKSIGMKDASIDENGYVMAYLPSNVDKKVETIGFIAHMDTAPDFSGENVKPQIVENYDGGDIILNKDLNIVLSPEKSPELKNYIGETLITTDGTTLLGADDKAGVAEIMTAMEFLINNPGIKHGPIAICFTPDEEVGRGADLFNVEKFGANVAYTMDGGAIGELECENFNAAGVKVIFNGLNVHPGYAKDKMINSMFFANKFIEKLPKDEVPELTSDKEGFYMLTSIDGSVEKTKLSYIIRDFDRASFENRKNNMKIWAEEINKEFGENSCEIEIKDQYYNMKEKIEPVKYVVDKAFEAMENCGIVPKVKAIRGGTDGARLSFMGLPTPNIFAGGENFHGKFEYVPISSMEKAVDVIVEISKLYAK
ncbi:peptidase T [Clostridium bornimense]|nr:peptidase T [Clostridium bornimense]